MDDDEFAENIALTAADDPRPAAVRTSTPGAGGTGGGRGGGAGEPADDLGTSENKPATAAGLSPGHGEPRRGNQAAPVASRLGVLWARVPARLSPEWGLVRRSGTPLRRVGAMVLFSITRYKEDVFSSNSQE